MEILRKQNERMSKQADLKNKKFVATVKVQKVTIEHC